MPLIGDNALLGSGLNARKTVSCLADSYWTEKLGLGLTFRVDKNAAPQQ